MHEADESVRRSCLTKDRARRGYSPMSTENFASLIGQQRPNDLVKKFLWRPIQKAVTGKESTAHLKKEEYNQVYEVLNRHLADKFGVSVPFPQSEP